MKASHKCIGLPWLVLKKRQVEGSHEFIYGYQQLSYIVPPSLTRKVDCNEIVVKSFGRFPEYRSLGRSNILNLKSSEGTRMHVPSGAHWQPLVKFSQFSVGLKSFEALMMSFGFVQL